MKKEYSKPAIYVEPMVMDTPIALGCTADKADMLALQKFGYFNGEYSCVSNVDTIQWGNDTICYHSNIQTAFLS